MSLEANNLVYIDEYRHERWLLKLKLARQTGEIAVFNALHTENAEVILFPERTPNDVA